MHIEKKQIRALGALHPVPSVTSERETEDSPKQVIKRR